MRIRVKHNHIVSFSGGKDSTAMLFMMLDRGMVIDGVVHAQTGYDFPEMIEHIDKVEGMIAPLTIDRVDIEFDYWFNHIRSKGPRKGTRGYGWPNMKNRWCTALKRQYSIRYTKKTYGKDIVEYIGIAADESHRVEKCRKQKWWETQYPLVDWGVAEADALEFCHKLGFDWGGLYERMGRVSCYLCPLSRIEELRIVYEEYPELWERMRELDKLSDRPFRDGLERLEEKFNG